MQVVGMSDIGLMRKRNEDSFLIEKETGIFIICDGMGGHKGGDVASNLAIETINTELKKNTAINLKMLNQLIAKANHNIWLMGHNNPDLHEMGTTLTLAKISDMQLDICHVGDSRAYLIRDNQIQQLTTDHTLAEEMAQSGIINKKQKSYKHILTRVLGVSESVEIDNISCDLYPDDLILLCSDGLSDMLSDTELLNVINENKELGLIGNELIKQANDNGGYDNISLILIRISGR